MKEKIAFYPTPKSIVEKMIELGKYKKEEAIFDTGFGEGVFIKTLQEKGYQNLYGIEYSTSFFEKLKSTTNNLNLFHNDFLSFELEQEIDHIIGNPPYINSDNLDEEVKSNVRNITKSGEGNIYYAFIIKSIQLLKEGGTLIYILPYDFFFNTYATKLRQYMIENGYFTDIIDFGETKLFKNAAPETIIFKYIKDTKKNNKPKINILQTKDKTTLDKLKENYIEQFKNFEIENFENEEIWSLSNIKKIEGKKLKDINGIKVSVGIVNGAENYFKLTKELKDKLTDREKTKYIKTFIKNSSRPENHNIKENVKKGIEYIYIPNNEFKTEEELENKAPNIYKHLKQYKEEMLKRKLSKQKQWFDYLAIRNLEVFEENKNKLKIHVPSLTRRKKEWFFKSKDDKYVGGDLLTITLKENEELLNNIYEYLNSMEFVEYYKKTGAKKGKRVVFTQKILSEIIIPRELLNKLKKC